MMTASVKQYAKINEYLFGYCKQEIANQTTHDDVSDTMNDYTFVVVVSAIWQCQGWQVLPFFWTFTAVSWLARNQWRIRILNLKKKKNIITYIIY